MTTFTVCGFENCGFYAAAVQKLKDLRAKQKGGKIKIVEHLCPRAQWPGVLAQFVASHGATNARLKLHKTSPLVFVDDKYVGGHDDLVAFLGLK